MLSRSLVFNSLQLHELQPTRLLSMEFSRQKYHSGLLFPTGGNLPKPGIELMSLSSPALAGRFFTRSPINGKLLLAFLE